MMLIGWLPSLAHDFEVDGIFYNKTSDNTAAVTYKGDSYSSYSKEYSGDIVIPSSVDYNGATYSVTSIGDEAFYWCDSLTSVVIGNSVTSIGDAAFCECSGLTSIEIPNSVKSIGYCAFYECLGLTSIEIPNSVTSIGDAAFCECSGLTSIVVDSGNTKYDSRNGCNAIIETASNALIAGCQNTIIPNSVTSIGDGVFFGCSGLTSIEIPNSVISIGVSAFYSCERLTSVVIGNSVTSIGDYAFAFCECLTSVVIGNSVTSIGESAFCGCLRLTSIEIPNSVTWIGDEAFEDCESLTKITCWATTPPAIYSNTFSNYDADLYVPAGCISAYQSVIYWRNFNNIIESTVDNPITLNDNNVTVASIGDYIVVKNATAGSVVSVYAVDGAMIASEVATEGDVIIEAPAKGMYVVVVDGKSFKVMVK